MLQAEEGRHSGPPIVPGLGDARLLGSFMWRGEKKYVCVCVFEEVCVLRWKRLKLA